MNHGIAMIGKAKIALGSIATLTTARTIKLEINEKKVALIVPTCCNPILATMADMAHAVAAISANNIPIM